MHALLGNRMHALLGNLGQPDETAAPFASECYNYSHDLACTLRVSSVFLEVACLCPHRCDRSCNQQAALQ
jgi:hypothetical protein